MVSGKSIAVLAFADLSPDQKSEYFADGISEEILNALAKVEDLKVAGRTSSFYFKDKNESIQTIGRALGVANVLEGSVRKQGDRVRITAQLIEVQSGFHLWSENYDGDLGDVFELQEQIARSITDQLRVVLATDQKRRLVPTATEQPEAYALFLQATAIFNRRDGRRFLQGIEQLEKAVALDPAYARAHARLASMYAIASEYTSIDLDRALAGAREHAEIAMALDPSMAEPHAALARVHGAQRHYVDEQAAFERALLLEPNDVTANFWFGSTLFTIGYIERANAAIDRALTREPMLPMALLWRGMSYSEAGDQDSAEKLLQRADDVGLALVGTGWSEVAEARGDLAEATRQLAAGTEVLFSAFPPGTAVAFARGCYGDGPAREQVLGVIDAYLANNPEFIDGIVPYALARLGRTEQALQLTASRRLSHPMYLALLWGPYGKSTRSHTEFSAFARSIGFAAVWDIYGAPDMCRKADNGAYVCG
jgi:TolB-like protein